MTFPTLLLLQLACHSFDVSNALAVDNDGDGYSFLDGDCDDSNAALGAMASDGDCDGIVTALDCDDADTTLGTIAHDGDCDRIVFADDCDDHNAAMGARATDHDCDGVVWADDCDDRDPASTSWATDGDCDGVLTSADCDDQNPQYGAMAEDADCDGVPTDGDCDDEDPRSTRRGLDADCDGVPTTNDCDDRNPNSTRVADDHDCDGVPTVNDCDDEDATSTTVATDHDCDQVVATEDCDDEDASIGSYSNDVDCDGAATLDDCDDLDPDVGAIEQDLDCDGATTEVDCDDTDPRTRARHDALDLNGSAYAVLPRASSMSFGTSWSASMWTYRHAVASAVLFTDGLSGSSCASMVMWFDGSTSRPAVASLPGIGPSYCDYSSGNAYGNAQPTGVWTHTVVAIDGTTVRFYQDGALTTTSTIAATDPYTPFRDMWVGVEAGRPSSERFDGAIGDLAFWTRALTSAEALEVYNVGPGSVTSGLVGWWPMDEGVGTTLHEASGLANDGTIYGTAAWMERCDVR